MRELERMTRRYTSEIVNEIGPEKDIPAPDVGTNAAVMGWIFDTFSMNQGYSVLGVVTGKPVAIGGSLGRAEATARGASYCLREAMKRSGRTVEGLAVAVQGFGNVGGGFARFASELGARVVAVSDSSGGRTTGRLDVEAALVHKRAGGKLAELTPASRSERASCCSMRRPRALRARRSSPRERGPRAGADRGRRESTTPAADAILEDAGRRPPDIPNAGGVVVSYSSGCRASRST